MIDYLGTRYPTFASKVRKCSFATLPTPVSERSAKFSTGDRQVLIKHDDQTSTLYGGNKIRKLEYLLQRAIDRGARRIATFGAAGSNHALATAIFAKHLGFECTCFLAHQKATANIPRTLNMHIDLGTEIVRYGGKVDRIALFRQYLQHRRTWVVPLGGTCWLGALGFVNAGLELAAQIDAGDLESPDRIYIANGSMGSVAGLALGLAISNKRTEIHAVRVADNRFTYPAVLDRLVRKTGTLLHYFDASIPDDLAEKTNVVWRDEFYAGGYAATDAATGRAIEFAHDQLDLTLESTYTGKAMAALLRDGNRGELGDRVALFWNTYSSTPLPPNDEKPPVDALPEEFLRYFDAELR